MYVIALLQYIWRSEGTEPDKIVNYFVAMDFSMKKLAKKCVLKQSIVYSIIQPDNCCANVTKGVNPYSAGVNFSRQNLTSVDV